MKTDKCLLINATGQQADKGDFFFKTIPNNTQVYSLTALRTAPTDSDQVHYCFQWIHTGYSDNRSTWFYIPLRFAKNARSYASKRPTSSWRDFQSSNIRSSSN